MRKAAATRPALAAAFIAAAMILGGGGSPNPATEFLLELVWMAIAVTWLVLPGDSGLTRHRSAWVIAALAVLVPVLQLVPLPTALWHALPGQQDRVAALGLIGSADRWQPLTLSPARTLAGLISLLPPAWLFLATAGLDLRGREWLLRAVAAVALAAALLGALQVSLGAGGPRLYTATNLTLTGFQANKNAAADVLLVGLLAGAAALAPSLRAAGSGSSLRLLDDTRAAWLALAGCVLVFVTATVLTQSRAGILLIPVALAGVWMIASPGLGLTGWRRWLPLIGLAVALAVGAAAVLLNATLGTAFARFAAEDDFRRELWSDAWFALKGSWPSGIGLGGASNALIAAERLEILDPSVPNRVHNDYLEFALEGGALAMAVLAASLALLSAAAWRRWRESRAERALTACGVTILVMIALHSFVDYPLRSMAMACLTGMGAGLLFAPSNRQNKLPGRIQGGPLEFAV